MPLVPFLATASASRHPLAQTAADSCFRRVESYFRVAAVIENYGLQSMALDDGAPVVDPSCVELGRVWPPPNSHGAHRSLRTLM